MKTRLDRLLLLGALGALTAGCARGAATPPVDLMATTVAQVAFDLLTQTAAAASPTPPPPTATLTSSPTAAPSETPTSDEPPRRPQTVKDGVECWLGGPGAPNILETHINHGKAVDLLGIGNTQGWYVIRDPYFHRPCWILGTDLKFFQEPDSTQYPVMTPGVPGQGQ
jgi:hypothetical protein